MNNFAISSAGLGQALRVGGAALAAANNSLDESIALITAGNNALQDPDTVGNALKTVSMRLRNTKGQLEELGEEAEGAAESITKLQTQILNRTGGKVNIMLDENTFKNTYQILTEIAHVWDDLSDRNRADILELIAGKHRATAVSSILTNIADAESALATSINSAGSAMREQEAYSRGIEYSLNRLSASFQDLSRSTIDSDLIKFIVDFGNALVNILDKIGLVNIALLTAFGFLGTKGLAKILVNTIPLLKTAALNFGILASNMGLSTVAASGLSKVLIGMIPIAAILAGIAAIKWLSESLDRQRQQVADLVVEVQSLQSEYDALFAKTDRTTQEENRLSLLKAELQLQKDNLKIEQQRLYNAEKFVKDPSQGYVTPNEVSWTNQYTGGLRDTIDEYNELNEITSKSLKQDDLVIERKNELLQGFIEEVKWLQEKKDANVTMLASDEQRLIQLQKIIEAYNTQNAELDETVQTMVTLEDVTTEMNTAVSDYAKSLSTLQEIEEKVKDGSSLSYEEKEKYLELYPELESAIYRTADGWSFEISKLKEIQEAERQTALVKAESSKKRLDIALQEALKIHRIVSSQINSYAQLWAALDGRNVYGKIKNRDGMNVIIAGSEYAEITKKYTAVLDAQKELEKIQAEIDSIGSGKIGGSKSKKEKDPFEELDKQFKERLQLSKNYIEDRNFYEDWDKFADNEIEAWKRVKAYVQEYYAQGKMSAELYAETIRDVNKQIYLAQKAIEESQRETLETIKDVEDQIVKLYEKQFDKKKDKLEEWYDEEKEVAKKSYENEKKILDKKLENFQKYIQEQKDALNDAYDEDTFNSDLAEKQSELAEIQAKINELSLSAGSGDRSAIAQRSDLYKELADKQKEIDKFVAERSRDLQLDALDDSLDDFEEHISNKEEILDANYAREVEQIDRLYQKKLKKLEENYSKEELYSKARKALMSGEYSEITSLFEEFQQEQGDGWSSLGEILQNEFVDKLERAADLLAYLQSEGINVTSGKLGRYLNGDSGLPDGYSGGSGNKNYVLVNRDGTHNGKTGDYIVTGGGIYQVGNPSFHTPLPGVGTTTDYSILQQVYEKLKSGQLFDKGGVNDYTGLAMLHGSKTSAETIFNASQSKKLYELIAGNSTADIAGMMFKNILSGISGSSLGSVINKSSTPISIGSLVTIEGSITDGNLAKVQKTIDNGLAEFAKKINSGNITLNKGTVL